MWNFILGLVLGAIVMDFVWAWRLGLPQLLWKKVVDKE